jgi:perosamine synthetase
MKSGVTRRSFMKSVGLTTAASSMAGAVSWPAQSVPGTAGKPALLGGTPVHQGSWPSWPQEGPPDEAIIMRALQEKRWCYLRSGAHFCKDYEKQIGTDYGGAHIMLTNAGTTALHACLYAMDIGPGDEVLVTGESFIATMQSILNLFALPIFVDVDPATGLMDADLLEQAVTPRTKAIMPVHLYGASCEMDKIMAVAKKHGLKVIEDACQSPYVEWDGHKLGTIGNCGAVSFNVWKTLGCGEGGMIVATDERVARACDAFRDNGRTSGPDIGFMGMNYRPTEFQAALLITQTEQYKRQALVRQRNAAILDRGLAQIPGLKPFKVYAKTRNHNYYNYLMHYDAEAMGGLPLDRFARALRAEGVPCSSDPNADIMSHDKSLDRLFQGRHFRAVCTPEQLKRAEASRACPRALHMVRNQVDFDQSLLLGSQSDMEAILEAVDRIRKHAAALMKT